MKIPIAQIRLDGDTQSRVSLNSEMINEYSEQMKEGVKFPPVIIFDDGSEKWLSDGFHRVYAARNAGFVEVEADVRKGTVRDARRFAMSANAKHGERRTNADKRRAVLMALEDEQWRELPNTAISDMCEVAESFVRKVRDERKEQKSHSASANQASPKKPDEAAKLREEVAYYEKLVKELETAEPVMIEKEIDPAEIERRAAEIAAEKIAEAERARREVEAERVRLQGEFDLKQKHQRQALEATKELLNRAHQEKLQEIDAANKENLDITKLSAEKRKIESELRLAQHYLEVERRDSKVRVNFRKLRDQCLPVLAMTELLNDTVSESTNWCGLTKDELSYYQRDIHKMTAAIIELKQAMDKVLDNRCVARAVNEGGSNIVSLQR